MRQAISIFIFVLTVGLFGCNPSTDSNHKRIEKTLSIDDKSSTKTQDEENKNKVDGLMDCARGQAKPLIKKSDYPNTTFVLQPDSISAIETVYFENSDKLIIRNWGCEYYVLTFRFETSRLHRDTADLAFWFRAANNLMTNILGGLDAPIDIKKGLVRFDSYILRDSKNAYKNLRIGEEIEFGSEDIRSFVTLDRIENIEDKKVAVTISFATGPL